MRTTLRCLAALVWLAACDDKVTGQKPVGGTVDTDAQIQHYLRRVNLDLSGHVPTDTDLDAQTAQLQQEERLADVQAKRLDAWALLMKELGGGFAATAADRAAMEPDDARRN